MKVRILLLLPAAALISWCAGAADEPQSAACASAAATAQDQQDLIFFHEARPFRFRLHLRVDGQQFRVVWNDFLRGLFQFLDADGNGVLSKKEVEHAPNPQQLLQQFQGEASVDAGPAPNFAELDTDPADGKVTLEELKAYYYRSGVGPLQVEVGKRQGAGDPLTDALFQALDLNHDGKLSKAELAAAASSLRKLDVDDDEMITVPELIASPLTAGFVFQMRPSSERERAFPPFQLIHPSDTPDDLARQLLSRYDKNKNHKLSPVEIGLDKAVFDRLDVNHDGELDAGELAKWVNEPADIELNIHLGKTSVKEMVNEVLTRKRRPLGPAVQKTGDGALMVAFRDTQIEVRRNGAPRINPEDLRESIVQRFKAADANKDGYLDHKEIYQPPFAFVALLRLADRDGDGKLSLKELSAYLEMQGRAPPGFTVLTIADRGRTLFEILDADRDGRLGLRELRSAWARLAPWDRDGDGCIARNEIPHQFQLAFGYGHRRLGDQVSGAPGYGPASRIEPLTKGPLWFRKMDRNHDGDVSRREFLGADEKFRQIDTDGDGLISVEEAERADALFRKNR